MEERSSGIDELAEIGRIESATEVASSRRASSPFLSSNVVGTGGRVDSLEKYEVEELELEVEVV